MIWMVFTPSFSAGATAERTTQTERSALSATQDTLFPSYLVFRDALNSQLLAAQNRVCILSDVFEDREIGLMVYGASRRALTTAIRMNPRSGLLTGRLARLADELRNLGIPIAESPLKSLKIGTPTLLAVDRRAWSIDAPLSETHRGPVAVEPAAWTAGEVCQWAQDPQSAKAATVR